MALSPEDRKEQELFEAELRRTGQHQWVTLAKRYMYEDTGEYDSAHTAFMFRGWQLARSAITEPRTAPLAP